MLIDTHAHAHFNAYKDDMDDVIKRSIAKGVVMNLVGTQRDTSAKGVVVAEKYPECYASIGLHPEHLFSKWVDENESPFQSREENFDYDYYYSLARHPKVIAIGECGLDFYRIPEGMTKELMYPKQKEVFMGHIRVARAAKLPMVIHCRDAHEELKSILLENITNHGKLPGTIHCYTSNWHNAESYLSMGFYIGFTGVITFPPLKANPRAQEDLIEVIKKMPLDKILLETDCPYLAPIPYRGKRGEPWMAEATAQKIAAIRGITLGQVLQATTKNARNLFTKIS